MTSSIKFLTVSKLVEFVLATYPDCKTIRVVFDPKKSDSKNKYSQYQISPSGLILTTEKTIALSYPKIIEMFGKPILISVSETKTRKVIPAHQIQILTIDTELQTYVQKESKETIAFYSSTIAADKSDVSRRLIQSRKDYKETPSTSTFDEDEIDFL